MIQGLPYQAQYNPPSIMYIRKRLLHNLEKRMYTFIPKKRVQEKIFLDVARL